jgi:hypothetical protein
MSKTDQFWQYAKEAMLAASHAKSDEERQDFLDLGRTWTQAALIERASSVAAGPVALPGAAQSEQFCTDPHRL